MNKAPIKSNISNTKSSSSSSTTTAKTKVASSVPPLKKESSVTSTKTTSSTSSSSIGVKKPITKSSGVTSSSSTTTQKTRSNISPTKRTTSTSSVVASKLGGAKKTAVANGKASLTEKQPSTTVKATPFDLTEEWLHSLLMDINLDHSLPLTNSKHPNHQFIKSKDESFMKEMENCLPYSVGDGERKLSPCDKSGIQFDGHYTTGHNVSFMMKSETFSFFSWTLILRVYVDEKSSCIFSFGPWYRWFVLNPSSVQLNQGSSFIGKMNGIKLNQWNDIAISFNFDQEKQSFDNCTIDKVFKDKKEILILCNGVENIFGIPSGSVLRGPEDGYGMNHEKSIGFLNMSNGCSLRGTVSSLIVFNKPCSNLNELKGISSTMMNLHNKPNGPPILIDQIPMPKSIPKDCIQILKGNTHFQSTIEKHHMIVFFFCDSFSMYQKRQYVFPFLNYFVDFFTRVGSTIKCGRIDVGNGNYDLKNTFKFKTETFIFYKNGHIFGRIDIDETTKLDALKQKFTEFEKLVGVDEPLKSDNTDDDDNESESKPSKKVEDKPVRRASNAKPIPITKKASINLEKPAEWLESVSADINIDYDIRIANPNHPNYSLYTKHNVLSGIVDQCRSSVDKNKYKEKAICNDWGIQFDGGYDESGDIIVEMKSAFFSKNAWSLFIRVYVASSSRLIFAFGPNYRWFVLTPDSLGLSNQQNHYSVEGIKYDEWNDIFVSFNLDLPKSPKDICKINNVIKNKMEILLMINDKKNSIPLNGYKFNDKLEPFDDNSIGFMNMGSGSCLRGVVSSLVILNKPCRTLDELENVGSFFLQNHVKYSNEPVIVDYKKIYEDNPSSKKSNTVDHGNTIDLSKENQLDQIIAKHAIVVVDFYATWCGPCMSLAPSMSELSVDYPTVKIVKVDVDKFPGLAQRSQVKAMPTILYYHKQKEVKRQQGGSKGSIDANIALLLAKK